VFAIARVPYRVGRRSLDSRRAIANLACVAASLLWVCMSTALAEPAATSVERTVHWAPSPTQDITGNSLPAAAAYEVWLTVDARPESLAAVVADTQKVLVLAAGSRYVVRVRARCAAGVLSAFSVPSDPFEVPKNVAGVDGTPTPAARGPAWPNPFNARVTLTYHVPAGLAADASFGLTIHDLRGGLLATLELDRRPGAHTVDWGAADRQGRRLASGVYVARYTCGGGHTSLRLTLVS